MSKIFSWFRRDFTKNVTLINYVNQYSRTTIDAHADISFLEYDWSLNDVAFPNR